MTARFQARRSLIFMPGNKPEMFPKAKATGADIVTIDIEDAVAPQHKDAARDGTIGLFADPATLAGADSDGVERMVRINCLRTPEGLRDVLAIIEADTPPPALMLPKVRSADEVCWLDELLGDRHPHVSFHVIIETCDGLENCYAIAGACARVKSLLFGAVDMAAELRCKLDWDLLLPVRARLVHAAARREIDLIDVPYLDLEDMEGMTREAERSADLGFTGKGAIHPKQIPVLNRVFSPDAEAIAYARKVVEAFDTAGTGLVLVDGKLIEKPVLRSMQRVLALADQIGAAGH